MSKTMGIILGISFAIGLQMVAAYQQNRMRDEMEQRIHNLETVALQHGWILPQ